MNTIQSLWFLTPRPASGTKPGPLGFTNRSCAILGLVSLLLCGAVPAVAQEVLLTIDGTDFERLSRFDGVGDLDGDGVPDLAVGIVSKDQVRVYSGANGNVLMEATGLNDSAFGSAVAFAGDFDGDGVPDIVVGAPNEHTAGTYVGAVHVVSGATGSSIASMYGEHFEEGFGYEVAGLGDLDQDGFDDVGASAKYHRRVRIYGGPEGHLIRDHTRGTQGYGTRVPSISSVGDVNGDAVPDYVVGWPTDFTGGGYTGTVALFSGRGGTALYEVYGPTPTGGDLVGSFLGISVAGVGDMDGDGIPDFAAGAPGTDVIGTYPPPTQASVRLYSGSDAHLLREWDGAEQTGYRVGAYFGFHVAGVGDLNGDGVPDLLAGAPHDGGTTRGTVSAFSGRTGERLWRIVGSHTMGRMRYCGIVGDLNADGLSDFATGDGEAEFGGSNSGRITVYAGALGDLERHCSADPVASPRAMRLETSGALGIGNNYLRLATADAPPGGLAIFVYGPVSPPLPMGGGPLCTGPPSYLLAPPLPVDANGFVEHPLDFTQPPLSERPSQVLPGSTWSFQLWCRDTGATSPGPRLSDGLAITFPP